MNRKRVAVGLSGGVDSSVAALLLKERGFDVFGVYLVGWLGEERFPCDWQSEEADARRVAQEIKIPFYSVNLSKEYQDKVIDQFFSEYQKGRTPNPDILCNSEIKFKALPEALRQFEPDYLATGHYAKIRKIGQEVAIVEPKDANKSQTYFLWQISREILPKIIFPLGEMTKQEVRARALQSGLITAKKRDSQGICFVGNLKVRELLASRFLEKAGDVVLIDGRKIAQHQGAVFYTIGQRLGAGSVSWTGDRPPLYVIGKDLEKNLLIVGDDSQTYSKRFTAKSPNWHLPQKKSFTAKIRVRYRQPPVEGVVSVKQDRLVIELVRPVRAITPGQSVVFYRNGALLGGAVVDESG